MREDLYIPCTGTFFHNFGQDFLSTLDHSPPINGSEPSTVATFILEPVAISENRLVRAPVISLC